MEYSYKTLNYSELKRLQYDLTPDNVCPRIFRFFDLPNARGMVDDDLERLAGDISIAESVFLAEVEVPVKNRIQEVSNLIKGELSNYLSSTDKVFLVFVSPNNKNLSYDEVEAIQSLNHINNGNFWYCLNYVYYKLKGITHLFIIAIKTKEGAYDENEMMNDVFDEINDLPLGKYRNVLAKQANDYCKSVIKDPANHSDAIITNMADFLQGAAIAIELSEKKTVPSNVEEIDDYDSVYFEDVKIGDLGQYRQVLMNEALSFAKETIYPNSNIPAVSSTIYFFLRGAEAAIKLIKEDSEKE